VNVNIAGGVEINLDKSPEENAEVYYRKAKNSKMKISGAEQIVQQTEKEIQTLLSKREKLEVEIEKKIPKVIEVVKKEWYEKFHWFFTSSGLLAIGGRDATQNEILIKKHVEIKDIVFHTELPGSPFFLLKEGRDKGDDKDKEEVSIATASYSRAWGSGRHAADVFWVKPEQVTKDANTGEYLSKGSFMVRGKKNQLRNTKMLISIGVDQKGRILSGPRTAIAKKTEKYVSVSPGSEKKSDIAKKVAHQIGTNKLDDVMRSLPAGNSTLLT